MKGLILKDLYNLKKQTKLFVILGIFYILFGILQKNPSFGIVICTVFLIILPITAYSFDERDKWNSLAVTMPVKRSHLVLSKYILAGIFTLVGLAFSAVCALAVAAAGTEVSVRELVLSALVSAGVGITGLSLVLPVVFKLGTEKGRIFMMAVFLIPSMMIVVIGRLYPDYRFTVTPELMRILPFAAVGLLVFILIVSMAVSVRIMQKKEI